MSIFVGLIHYPVLNRHGEVASTAVTNVDVHDLARAGRSYGVEKFFVVTPIALQQTLLGRVVHHWAEGNGATRIPTRALAFQRVEVVDDIATAVSRIEEQTGQRPQVAVTGAGLRGGTTSFETVRRSIWEAAENGGRPVFVLFGTGWGLAPEVIEKADIRLPAIDGPPWAGGYNHLSVRAAAVVVMDRLLGASRE